jgi:uncharacterized protein DUF3500
VEPATDGARVVAERMSAAALAWLDTLTDEQRTVAVGIGPDVDAGRDAERRRWFYTPTDHGGLTLHAQHPAQQRLAMALLATGCSRAAFVTAVTIMGLENVLDHNEGFTAMFDRERGRDPGLYYLRVFGDPAGVAPWGWRFGGHHVSVSQLVVEGRVAASTPSFLGANPASAPLMGSSLRPLEGSEDLARELMRSLSEPLAKQALLLSKAPADIIGGNRTTLAEGDRVLSAVDLNRGPLSDPKQQAALESASDALDELAALDDDDHVVLALTAAPKGVSAAELDAEQRELLRLLLSTYLDRVPMEISAMGRYADDLALEAVHFAWAGSTSPGERHYYRLQGPRLLIEWDNTQSSVNHAHAAWRDPESDFGLDVLAAHRAAYH